LRKRQEKTAHRQRHDHGKRGGGREGRLRLLAVKKKESSLLWKANKIASSLESKGVRKKILSILSRCSRKKVYYKERNNQFRSVRRLGRVSACIRANEVLPIRKEI